MVFLLCPAHRKFIKLLRKYISEHAILCISYEDIIEIENFFAITDNSLKRHKCVYRVFIRAMQRNRSDIIDCRLVIDKRLVRKIERILRKNELTHFRVTLGNAFVIPCCVSIIKYLERSNGSK